MYDHTTVLCSVPHVLLPLQGAAHLRNLSGLMPLHCAVDDSSSTSSSASSVTGNQVQRVVRALVHDAHAPLAAKSSLIAYETDIRAEQKVGTSGCCLYTYLRTDSCCHSQALTQPGLCAFLSSACPALHDTGLPIALFGVLSSLVLFQEKSCTLKNPFQISAI